MQIYSRQRREEERKKKKKKEKANRIRIKKGNVSVPLGF